MNIEEAKRKLHNMAFRDLNTKPDKLRLQDVYAILDQLDQTKVVVPQFVAEWYEENKEGLWETVIDLIRVDERLMYKHANPPKAPNKEDKRFLEWLFREDDAFEILSDMHQFSYEVEQENLYTVDLPNGQPLVRGKNTLYFSQNLTAVNAHLTEREIRKDFDWAWQFAKEVTE
ncbi:DUF1642 domain-containing protein [Streptococcus dysgalactiae]|uniref:DUF1642 domain-containing protein n=1 Tax=Streptococcus dysgalactiae TaxID=1334 RepID=UPI001CF14A1A|nr:DUF1642 domain-containing protein [Streptococcus dysgalactiae]MCB2848798.1 DUF1642 domain-containing protein [Streptococcus dysgalactiae subsp. dysgalactiae]